MACTSGVSDLEYDVVRWPLCEELSAVQRRADSLYRGNWEAGVGTGKLAGPLFSGGQCALHCFYDL